MAPIAVGDHITQQLYLTELYFRLLQRNVCIRPSVSVRILESQILLALKDTVTFAFKSQWPHWSGEHRCLRCARPISFQPLGFSLMHESHIFTYIFPPHFSPDWHVITSCLSIWWVLVHFFIWMIIPGKKKSKACIWGVCVCVCLLRWVLNRRFEVSLRW